LFFEPFFSSIVRTLTKTVKLALQKPICLASASVSGCLFLDGRFREGRPTW